MISRNRKKTLGQTMTEYIIIVALCAIGLLIVVTFFGNDIKEIFYTSSASLRGGKATDINYSDEINGVSQPDSHKDHGTGGDSGLDPYGD